MALSDFYPKVARSLGRGNSLDSRIPDWTEQAAEFLEQNYAFQYMRKTGTVLVDASGVSPWRIDFPSPRLRSIDLIRSITSYPGNFEVYGEPLKPVSESRVTSRDGGVPSGYWLDGLAAIVLDVVPQQDYTFGIAWYEFTDWPTDDSATPTLLARYQNLLKGQTILFAAAELRDSRLNEIWSDPGSLVGVPAALNAALRVEEELKADSDQTEIPYVPRPY